ncbi:Uncharacterised protein [Mycobacteroides abscessus subsp. abscessus]|nr:Uncharacterised protein [Mycobacteroides abscessus subsp. abscessus]
MSQFVRGGECPNCRSNIYGYGVVNNCPLCNAKVIWDAKSHLRDDTPPPIDKTGAPRLVN